MAGFAVEIAAKLLLFLIATLKYILDFKTGKGE